MKHINIISTALLALAAAGLTACDDDKQLTLNADQAYMVEGITFDVSETLPLAVGMDSTLVYKVLPEDATNKTVVFTSSDPSVATVDADGTIHAVKVGRAIITGRSEIGFKVFDAEAAVVVQVIPEVIKAQTIDVICDTEPDDQGRYYVTDLLQFHAEILPADHTYSRVEWMTTDPEVATIDKNGLLTCVAMGDVKVLAVATDRSGVRGEYDLHVDRLIGAERVEVAPLAEPLCITKGSVELAVTYYPADATVGSVEWSSDDESIAVVKRGVVSPRGFGTANITAKCVETGYTVTIPVTVEPGLYIWDASNQWSGWYVSQPGNHLDADKGDVRGDKVWRLNLKNPGAGGKWRADFRYTCDANNVFTVLLKEYPVVALRMTRISSMNSKLDASATGYGNASDKNPKNGTDLGDGTSVLIYDLPTCPNYGTATELQFTNFQFKMADIPYDAIDPAVGYYDIYWIRTFKSAEDALKYAKDEVAAGK